MRLRAALFLTIATSVPAVSPACAEDTRPILATPDQLATERLSLRILARPEIRAARARVAEGLKANPAARTAEGLALLDHALDLWLAGLVAREARGDPARPAIVWSPEVTPHRWHGLSFPGTAVAGDNPDNIYRVAFIDGHYAYELSLEVPRRNGPAQFNVEITRGTPGDMQMTKQGKGNVDIGNQIAMLTDSTIQTGADGRVTLTLDETPANGRKNHVQIPPVPISVTLRNSLSDWRQEPLRATIRRTDRKPAPPARSEAAIAASVAANLGPWVEFWAKFKEIWMGAPPANTLAGPLRRDGGWGFAAAGPFSLADDEAIVATLTKGGAAYTGFQILDRWLMAFDSHRHITSRNSSQVTPNPDGSVTYVIAPRDPGAPNWIDTAGLHQGFVNIRWQKMAAASDAATAGSGDGSGLVRSYRVVKTSELRSLLPPGTRWITPQARAGELAARAISYDARLRR